MWIAERAAHPGLADLTGDFVLVDDEAGVWFRYDERGRLVGYERVAPEDLDRCANSGISPLRAPSAPRLPTTAPTELTSSMTGPDG